MILKPARAVTQSHIPWPPASPSAFPLLCSEPLLAGPLLHLNSFLCPANLVLRVLFVCVPVEDFQRLQQAKETLTNEERRARYDHWRRSRVTVPFRQWEALSSSVRAVRAGPGRRPGAPALPSAAAPGSGRGDGAQTFLRRACWGNSGETGALQEPIHTRALGQ